MNYTIPLEPLKPKAMKTFIRENQYIIIYAAFVMLIFGLSILGVLKF